MVFGPARPLREVLTDLAALFNNRWEQKEGSDGKQSYILTRSLSARQYEARLLGATTDRLLAKMEEQVRALRETPRQLARRPKMDMIRHRLSDPRGRLGTALYGSLTPAQRRALFSRERLHVPYQALTPEQQRQLAAAFGGIIRAEEEFAESSPTEILDTLARRSGDLERDGLLFTLIHSDFVQVMVRLDPSRDGTLFAAAVPAAERYVLPPHGNPYSRKPLPTDADLPNPAHAGAAAAEKGWPDRLRKLSELAGVPILADYYRAPPIYGGEHRAAAPAPDEKLAALDRLCKPEGYLWWTRDRTLLLRKRDWYRQRLYEPADGWLVPMVEGLQARGGPPTWGDLGRVSELTPEQIAGLLSMSRPLHHDHHRLPALRLLFALVNATPGADETAVHVGPLSREVRERILLTADSLTDAQRRMLPPLAAEQARPLAREQLAGFGAYFLCPREELVETSGGQRHIAVTVMWGFERAHPRVAHRENTMLISLPLSLPDDRRDRTRVELAP
jgi:hypothetical protein